NKAVSKSGPTQAQESQDEYEEDEEDELMMDMSMCESDLKFNEVVMRLANPRIVRACGLALSNFSKNSALTNHCIIKLLHRIAFDCSMSTMLFQVSIFRIFERIYEEKVLPQNKEMVKFASYVIRQFFQVAEKNQHVFMEALFWKNHREAFDIQEGYGVYFQKQSAVKAWTDMEEDELRKLFIEHRENLIEEDVVDWIVSNLIDNTRTRRVVLKKLKDMCLLIDYKGPRKSGISGKAPKQWGEDEEAQLQELYEEFKDAMDPLNCIMPRLDVHRPKNRIIEKLLVMGLVQDRKELRKKRSNKSHQQHGRSDEDGSSDSESEMSSEQRNRSNPDGLKLSAKKKTNKKKKNNNKKESSGHARRASVRDLSATLISLMAAGEHADALGWLKESFEDAIEDLDDDADEGVPLVPIMDQQVAAMDSEEFKGLLRGLGISEPSDEQETYWRMPPSLSMKTMKENCDLIAKALDKTLTVPEIEEEEPIEEPQQERPVDSSSDDEDVFDRLKRLRQEPVNVSTPPKLEKKRELTHEETMAEVVKSVKINKIKSKLSDLSKKRAVNKAMSLIDFENDDDDVEEEPSSSKPKRRIRAMDSSDDEETDDKTEMVGPDESNRLSFKPSRILDYDSDDDTSKVEGESNNERPFKTMQGLESDSDEDIAVSSKRIGGRSQILDSDDEESNKRSRSASDTEDKPIVKKARVIASDDED
ncbi:PREDICTED: protein timeless homolog, partial [Nicrophorus vespilloides]|uniref:Protein timeless homolog n=1 Tax=Nicrophorus vespilloides TaxID=110193 RepID=A0ABM1NA10_NICVS